MFENRARYLADPEHHGVYTPSVPPLTSVARLVLARTDAITGPPLEPAPQKPLKSQKKTQNTPAWSRPKRGGAGHPTSVAQIGVVGLCIFRDGLDGDRHADLLQKELDLMRRHSAISLERFRAIESEMNEGRGVCFGR
jgi:hypothetical protein